MSDKKTKPKLSRDETLQIFIDMENEKTGIILEAFKSGKIKTLRNSQDEQLVNSFIGAYPAARAFDKLMIEREVTEAEFEAACKFYRTTDDPTVVNCQQRNFIKIAKAERESQK